jgi:PKD repeat protein
MNKYLLFFLLSFFALKKQAISQDCGTIASPQNIETITQLRQNGSTLERDFVQGYNSGVRSPSIFMPIKAHIVRPNSGFGGLTPTQLQDAIDEMNVYFSNAGILFYLCEGIHYINSSSYYDFNQSSDASFTSLHNANNQINIYFFNSVTSSSGSGLCGYTSLPGGNDRIMMANSCAINGSTLTHEMGHFFGLYHTHGKTNTGTTDEYVNGSNCSTNGDDICDTPADPNLSGLVNFSCFYTGTATDLFGDTYLPNPRNVMSYARKECRDYISAGQYARIFNIATTSRNYFTCPSAYADFTSNVQYSCNSSLTVQFTDNSINALSWEWDIDNDGTADYTTQNITHTYSSPGAYTVSLKITTSQGQATETKTNYIQIGGQSLPYSQDFENFSSNSNATGLNDEWTTIPSNTTSSFRWNVNNSTTPSSSTGPNTDNTLKTTAGHYMYTEASSGDLSDTTILNLPCMVLDGYTPVFEFSYHMYGSDMGSLHLDINTGNGWINDIMTPISSQQQFYANDTFVRKQVDLLAYAGQSVNFRFRGIRGTSYRGDMAIDDINIYDTTPGPYANFTANTQYSCASALTVQFTDNSINNATAWEWDIDNDGTVDYTTQNVTHTYSTPGSYTVSLKITTALGQATETKNSFIQVGGGVLPYTQDFESFTTNYNGTGLDDSWTNSPNNTVSAFRWNVHNSYTASSNTGPSVDNTLKNSSGHYMYTESTEGSTGSSTTLELPCINLNGDGPILEFAYHMYGFDMGSLHLDINTGSGWINDVMTPVSGSQQMNSSDTFLQAQVNLSAYSWQVANLRFRAIKGVGSTGDIAIDDINLYNMPPNAIHKTQDSNIQNFIVSPNPSDGFYNVQFSSKEIDNASIIIYNAIGEEILTQNIEITTGDNQFQLHLNDAPLGIYLLQLKYNSSSQQISKRIIKH